MPRIAGVDLPRNKRVVIGLAYLYGIGKSKSKLILSEAGVDESIRTDNLTEDQVSKIRTLVERERVEGDLRREVQMNVKRLMDLGYTKALSLNKSPKIKLIYT